MTLIIEHLAYTFPGWPPTLRDANLRVAAGSSAFLLGPSGSGKTTLLRCIAGLEQAHAGTISWNDERLDTLPAHKRGVGMLFQEPALFPHLNVVQNVAFSRRDAADAKRWLDLVGLAHKAESRVDELSGGERQRVALARTLAAKPRVVLLDEPLSALDQTLRESLGARIRALLRDAGVAALWVTHDEEEAARLGDQRWRLSDGIVRAVG